MLRSVLVAALALVASGCATFVPLSQISPDSSHGTWVSKKTSLFGLQLSDEAVLFCSSADVKKPLCLKAGGDVGADVAVTKK